MQYATTEPEDDGPFSPGKRYDDAAEAYSISMEEAELEKKINPVGFTPGTVVENLVAERIKDGKFTGAMMLEQELIDNSDVLEQLHTFLKDNRPARYFIPNYAQEKAILPLKDIDPLEAENIIGIFTGGNMVGKTTTLACPMSVGLIWGKQELNEFFHDWKIFDKFEHVRKTERRPLRGRILCHSGGMEDGGQVMEEITKWWPKGLYKWEKNHKAYYSVCKCWDYDGNLLAVINVRTHDQPRSAHAGHTLDFILPDEPPPEHLWAETVARLRQRMGGLLWGFLSPLEGAGWIKDRLMADETIFFTQASIWDNCSNHHPDPKMWTGGKVGSGTVKTRGVIARKIIERHIREWEKEGPEVALARTTGEFTHLAGSVLKEFDQFVHVISPFPIPPHWPIFQGLDPHDAKPHLAGWVTQNEQGDIFLFESYPPIQWDRARGGIPVSVACADWRVIEEPFRNQIIARVGDPKRLRSTIAGRHNMTDFQKEFSAEGFNFELGQNAISTGLSRLREALMFDRKNPNSRPHFFIMSHSPYSGKSNDTFIKAMQEFSYKLGSGDFSNSREPDTLYEEKWKDPIDVLRYLIMRIGVFQPITRIGSMLRNLRRPRIQRAARPWNR